jgi:hypothetical protein
VRIGCAALVLLVVAAITATIAIPVVRGRQRRQASQTLDQSGAEVAYAYQIAGTPPRSGWSVYAEEFLGMDVEPAIYIGSPDGGWTDREIALLHYFPEVGGVNLGPSELSGTLLEKLRQQKNLATLALSERPATRQTLANLKYFPTLTSLSLSADLDDEAWQALAGLSQLKTLDLVNCSASVAAPACFRSAECRIEQVSLLGDLPDNTPLLHELRSWPSLKDLRVLRVTLDDAVVQTINSLPELELLELYRSRVPAGFSPAALTGKKLQNLSLISSEIQREAHARCTAWKGQPKIDLSDSTAVD